MSDLILPGDTRFGQAPANPTHIALRPKGGAFTYDEAGQLIEERDTLQCVHCEAHWRVDPGSGKVRGWCARCDGVTCGKVVCETSCRPFEMWLESREGKTHRPIF